MAEKSKGKPPPFDRQERTTVPEKEPEEKEIAIVMGQWWQNPQLLLKHTALTHPLW